MDVYTIHYYYDSLFGYINENDFIVNFFFFFFRPFIFSIKVEFGLILDICREYITRFICTLQSGKPWQIKRQSFVFAWPMESVQIMQQPLTLPIL